MAKGPKDSKLPKINMSSFIGGEAIDLKNGIPGSVQTSLAMDFRQKASQATILPGMKNIATESVLSDLITCMEQDLSGIRYGVGDQGYVYEIDKTNTVTSLGQLDGNGGAGIVYSPQNDNLYMSSQQSVSLYGQCTQSSPSLSVGHFGASASTAPGVIYTYNTSTSSYDGGTDSNTGDTTVRNNLNTLTVTGITPSNYASNVTNTLTNTYKPPNAISESSGDFCAFVPDIEPFYGVTVYIKTVGTGDLTLTMHDSLNNDLGAVTITNASLTTGWNLFTFTAPGIRAFVNAVASNTLSTGYHFHLTSSVSSDTTEVYTIVANDLTGCNFVLFAYRLVETNNGWHPMNIFNQYMCILNGNYLSTYNFGNDSNPNNSQWVRHQLFFDIGYEGTGLSNTGQYEVITAGRVSTDGTKQYQGGYIYLWDGINSAPNLKVPVPMGIPYAPFCVNNVVYFFCNGSLFAYAPGSPMVNKVRYIGYQSTDFMNTEDTTIVNPNMMTMRYNVLHMAYPTSTTNVSLKMGVYTWGAVELIYPNSFGYSYLNANQQQLASGTLSGSAYTGYKIGMLENFVDQMYMSSQYTISGTTHYRLDLLDNTCGVAATFGMRCLMWDGGARYQQKKGLRVKINFTALPSGVDITPFYVVDRGSKVTSDPGGNSYTVTGDGSAVEAFINVPTNMRSHELEWGFDGTTTGTVLTSPAITGIAAEIDVLEEDGETDLRPDG